MIKQCVTCKENKEETEFYSRKRWKMGECKSCIRRALCDKRKTEKFKAIRTLWNKNNPNYYLVAGWKFKKIPIGMAQFEQMFTSQEERCAICRRHSSEFKRRLAVDHDHESGAVRGLLCSTCNTGLGAFRDNTGYLSSAIAYLEKTGQKVVFCGK